MDDEKLIEEVRKYSELYDMSNRKYSDNVHKEKTWNKIWEKLNTTGDGLGKNSDGIAKPLRANLKFDTAGLGVDKGAEFTNNWWERIYSEASKNIRVNNDNGSCNIEAKDLNSFEITTKSYSLKNEGPYSNFVQRATIGSSGYEVETPEKMDIDELPKFKALTDEELFAACGGRTAHKAARHGLKLSGKLARIEEQERQFLNKISLPDSNPQKSSLAKNEKKKLRKRNATKSNEDTIDCLSTKKTKNSKHSKCGNIQEVQQDYKDYLVPKKRKKSKHSKCDYIQEVQQDYDNYLVTKKRKKSKRTKCDNIQEVQKDYDNYLVKKKSKKSKHTKCDIIQEVQQDYYVANNSVKNKKTTKRKKTKKSELTECSISIKKNKKNEKRPTIAQVNKFLNDCASVPKKLELGKLGSLASHEDHKLHVKQKDSDIYLKQSFDNSIKSSQNKNKKQAKKLKKDLKAITKDLDRL